MHPYHKRAVIVIAVAAVLDLALGTAFGYADRIGTWNGLYFATSVATTSGNSPFFPHGWPAYALALAMHLTMIPLWLAAFSLLTSGLTSGRVEASEKRMKTDADMRHSAIHDRLDAIQQAVHAPKRRPAAGSKGAQAGTPGENG